jgi:hypothetical protein
LRPGLYVITGKSATGATSTIYVFISGSNSICKTGKEENENLEMTEPGKAASGNLKVNVYPNPSPSTFTVRIEDGSKEDAYIIVSNINGQKMFEGRSKTFSSLSFGSNFPSGVYVVKVIQGKTVQTIKVIKGS